MGGYLETSIRISDRKLGERGREEIEGQRGGYVLRLCFYYA